MMKIFKYTVPFSQVAKVVMPKSAQIIRIDGIDGQIYLWAIIDTEEQECEHTFHLFKTGMQMPDDILTHYQYLGCGGIVIGMELMMYVFRRYDHVPVPLIEQPKWTGFEDVRKSSD